MNEIKLLISDFHVYLWTAIPLFIIYVIIVEVIKNWVKITFEIRKERRLEDVKKKETAGLSQENGDSIGSVFHSDAASCSSKQPLALDDLGTLKIKIINSSRKFKAKGGGER
jgi:hypothetical protein